jgi:hypothetical protein
MARHGAIRDTHTLQLDDRSRRFFRCQAAGCDQGSQRALESFDVVGQGCTGAMEAPMGEFSTGGVVRGILEDRGSVRMRCPSDVIEVEVREYDVRDSGDVNARTTQLVLEATSQATEVRARLWAKPSVDQYDTAALLQSEDCKSRAELAVREPSPDKLGVPGQIRVWKGVG